ncbi:MAG TPA: hypothetical protein VMK13_09105 [Streptosporangiaceae bacterium]|nr:hypothetical protein [Streptosporangiaceae bacterium]
MTTTITSGSAISAEVADRRGPMFSRSVQLSLAAALSADPTGGAATGHAAAGVGRARLSRGGSHERRECGRIRIAAHWMRRNGFKLSASAVSRQLSGVSWQLRS